MRTFVWWTLATLGLGNEDFKKQEFPDTVIGIDLGTTYSCVGIYKNGGVEIIPNDQGNRITPSYVHYNKETCERTVGEGAKLKVTTDPAHTIYDAKRLIGRLPSDTQAKIDRGSLSYNVVESDKKLKIKIQCNNREILVTPEEVSAAVLTKMKESAEKYLGKKVENAVITVPAYFTDSQRQATKDAGAIAGLNVLRIINEPTAAAIAYGLNENKEQNILVYDLGGGTFDVSVLSIDGGVFEVIATNGNTHLGGEDLDRNLVEYLTAKFNTTNGVSINRDPKVQQVLRRAAERAKRQLSTDHAVTIEEEALYQGMPLSAEITRAKFEDLNSELFKSTLHPVRLVMEDSGLTKDEIHEIVLVGGSTRIPKVQEILSQFFDGRELSRNLNPDEAVAYGAAVQGGILSGNTGDKGLLLLDVTPLTLGIETIGGVMSKMIPRNSVIPAKKIHSFTTTSDNQHTVVFPVYEGERPLTKDNHLLGKFDLDGIAAAPRGVPSIEVVFEVDANGILHVTATDRASSKTNSITIRSEKGRLSDLEIQRMVEEAEKHAADDAAILERESAKRSFDNYIDSLEKSMRSFQGKVSDQDYRVIQEATAQARQWYNYQADSAEREQIQEQQTYLQNMVAPILKDHMGPSTSGSEYNDDFEEL